MGRRFFLIIPLTAITLFSRSSPAAVTFEESYREALAKAPELAMSEQDVKTADESQNQAIGTFFPKVSFLGTYTHQFVETSSGVPSVLVQPETTIARFNATQAIFHGTTEYAELRRLAATKRAQQAVVAQTRAGLLRDVAVAYFQVLSDERDQENLRSLLELTDKRLNELTTRARIGRSRRGELLAAQSQKASLIAQVEAGKCTLRSSRETWSKLTGLSTDSELAPLAKDAKPASANTADYLAKLKGRPDIEAAAHWVEAADASVSSAFGGHLPSLDMSANYYLQRTGIPLQWDFGFTLTVPIFQGGIVTSQVRSAVETRKRKELELARARRDAESEVRTLCDQLKNGAEQLRALEEAVAAADENYQQQMKDFRLGLVSSLDLIQAMDSLLEVRRQLDRTRHSLIAAQYALKAAVGETTL